MARPIKNTVDYFPHDANASNSDTLKILEKKYGSTGFAFWFKLLEKLCRTEGHYIDCNNSVKWQLLLTDCVIMPVSTVETHINTSINNLSLEEIGEKIMNTLVDLDAIDTKLWKDSRIIWCQKLVNNVEEVYINRRRELPKKPFTTIDNSITTVNNSNSTVLLQTKNPQSKVKESKVKKSKNNNICPYQDIIDLYNGICISLPKVRNITDSRKRKLNIRFNEHKSIDVFREVFVKVENSKFCKGDNKQNWKVTFDWLVDNDRNMVKVLEGNYDNEKGKNLNYNQSGKDGSFIGKKIDEVDRNE